MEDGFAPPQGHHGLRPHESRRHQPFRSGTLTVTFQRCTFCAQVWRREEDAEDRRVAWSVEG